MSRRILNLRSLLTLSCGVTLASAGSAQVPLYNIEGTKANDRLGAGVASAGQLVGGDALNDFLVGAPEDANPFTAGPGFVEVRSGADGTLAHTIVGDPQDFAFGSAVDGGLDVNGDSVPDIVVAAPRTGGIFVSSGRISVRSGVAGNPELFSIFGSSNNENLGRVLMLTGDLDGNGRSEIMAGSERAFNDFGVVRVFRDDGSLMHTFTGGGSGARLGTSVDVIEDIDSDNVPDLVIGSGFDGVHVYSGASGSLIYHSALSPGSEPTYGFSVAVVEDLNSDGKEDILVGAPQFNIFFPGTGKVYVRDGDSGNPLFDFDGGSAIGDGFGIRVAGVGDWNFDGRADFMVSSDPQTGGAHVSIHSGAPGANGATLSVIHPDASSDDLGWAIAGLGNIDGSSDGTIEVLVGAPYGATTNLNEGYARVYSSPFAAGASGSPSCDGSVSGTCPCPGAVSAPNAGCPNSGSTNGAFLVGTGTPSISGDTFGLAVSSAAPGKPGLVLAGTSQNPGVAPMNSAGLLCVGGSTQRGDVFFTDGMLGSVNLPTFQGGGAYGAANNVIAGMENVYQFWFRDPNTAAGCAGGDNAAADFNFTNAWVVTWTP